MTGASELERFVTEVATNQPFRDELMAVGADSEAIVRFANAKGYEFSMADVHAQMANHEATDELLDQVAGGFIDFGGIVPRFVRPLGMPQVKPAMFKDSGG
jgi:predicted ribosomally synthesized peptide with nif11-like leader